MMDTAPAGAVIELAQLEWKTDQGRVLLQSAECRFAEPEFTVVAGQTGAGKTSLARVLNASLRPSGVRLSLAGKRIRKPSEALRAGISLVPQDPAGAFIGRSVREEFSFGSADPAEIERWLAWAELGEAAGLDPRALSFGEQRRLSLALALAADPRFLLLDDPFMGLDQQFIPRLLARLVERHQAGKGCIIFSNELEKVLAHADRLILLKQGRVIADALPARVLPWLDAHGFRKPTQKLAEMTWLRA